MAILYDDDFQSYTVGSHGPYGNIQTYPDGFAGNTTVVNDVPGMFGDVKSISCASFLQLQYPIMPFMTLPDVLAGMNYPDLGVPAYGEFSFFFGYRFNNHTDQQGTPVDMRWNHDRFNGSHIAGVKVRSDGAIAIMSGQGQSVVAVSDFSMLCEKFYWIQCNFAFFTIPGTHPTVGFTGEVAINNTSVVSATGDTGVRTSMYGLDAPYVNNILFGGSGQGVNFGRLTINDSIQAIGTNPHPGTPDARISQGVIELIQAINGSGTVSYARIGNSATGLSFTNR